MSQPTNAKLEKEIGNLRTAMIDGFDKVNKRIDPIHDFMVGQKAIAGTKKGTQSEALIDVLKWALLIIAGLLGVKLV